MVKIFVYFDYYKQTPKLQILSMASCICVEKGQLFRDHISTEVSKCFVISFVYVCILKICKAKNML